jgi:hypothetical protein
MKGQASDDTLQFFGAANRANGAPGMVRHRAAECGFEPLG